MQFTFKTIQEKTEQQDRTLTEHAYDTDTGVKDGMPIIADETNLSDVPLSDMSVIELHDFCTKLSRVTSIRLRNNGLNKMTLEQLVVLRTSFTRVTSVDLSIYCLSDPCELATMTPKQITGFFGAFPAAEQIWLGGNWIGLFTLDQLVALSQALTDIRVIGLTSNHLSELSIDKLKLLQLTGAFRAATNVYLNDNNLSSCSPEQLSLLGRCFPTVSMLSLANSGLGSMTTEQRQALSTGFAGVTDLRLFNNRLNKINKENIGKGGLFFPAATQVDLRSTMLQMMKTQQICNFGLGFPRAQEIKLNNLSSRRDPGNLSTLLAGTFYRARIFHINTHLRDSNIENLQDINPATTLKFSKPLEYEETVNNLRRLITENPKLLLPQLLINGLTEDLQAELTAINSATRLRLALVKAYRRQIILLALKATRTTGETAADITYIVKPDNLAHILELAGLTPSDMLEQNRNKRNDCRVLQKLSASSVFSEGGGVKPEETGLAPGGA